MRFIIGFFPILIMAGIIVIALLVELSLNHRVEYLSHSVSTAPESPSIAGKLVQGYVAVNLDTASKRPAHEICLPEEAETSSDKCLEFPRDFSEGRYKVLGVREWNVDWVSKVCYHDWLVRKWKEGTERVSGNYLTYKVCKETAVDDGIGMSIKTPQCTVFNDAAVHGYIPVSISSHEGHIFRKGGKYFLHTLRSNVELDDVHNGKHILMSDDTCILADIEKSVVSTIVPWGSRGFKVGSIFYKRLGEFMFNGQHCWTASGDLEVCECSPNGEQADPRLDVGSVTFLAAQVEADKHREILDAFCHLCESKPLLSIKLGYICVGRDVTKVKVDYLQARLVFSSGIFQSHDWCLSLQYGVLLNCNNKEYLSKLEYFPSFVYINSHDGLLNCTTDQHTSSVTNNCKILPQESEVNLSKHLTDYHTAKIFFPKTKQQIDKIKEILSSPNFSMPNLGFWSYISLIKDLIFGAIIVGAIILGISLWKRSGQPIRYDQVRTLPRGTMMRVDEL
ncbi:TPA_asm: P8 [Picris trirhavirus 1]|nr:TPA_asm: P8 [Picris trirhavirus 1]